MVNIIATKPSEVVGKVVGKVKMPSTEFDAILNRLKVACGFKTNYELTDFLGVKAQSIGSARKRGKIPPEWILSVSINSRIAPEWLITGEEDYQASPCLQQEQRQFGKKPQQRSHNGFGNDKASEQDWSSPLTGQFKISEALTMATRVLESKTSYALALYLNIQHFDRAIQAETRITHLEQSLSSFGQLIDKQQQQIADLKRQIEEIKEFDQNRKSTPPGKQVA